MAVGHPIHAVGRVVVPAPDMAVAGEDVPLYVAREVLGERLGLEIDSGVEEAALDPGPLAGPEAADVAGEDAHGEQRPAVLVDDGRSDRRRADLVVGGDRHQPRARLHQQVLPGRSFIGPAAPRPVADAYTISGLRRRSAS